METLGYFSEQIASALEAFGYDTYCIDYERLYESLEGVRRFAVRGETALLTFNFIGLGDEEIFREETGGFLWEAYDMKYLNILVDHPFYYHARLVQVLPRMTLFCVDREHAAYVKRFYPGIPVKFLPLAGNMRDGEALLSGGNERDGEALLSGESLRTGKILPPAGATYKTRVYDLVFTANYVPPAQLERQICLLDEEYRSFYRGILEDLILDPAQSVDAVMERHIRRELGDISDCDLRSALGGMVLIDLYARTYFRGEVVRTLAEQGVRVDVFGAGWEMLSCGKPENIIRHGGQVTSAVCVEAVRNARLSLNLMPWFKDGAHDRIFTAMLQRTVCVTDDSRYLRGEFADGEGLVYFSLKERERLPELVKTLLHDAAELEEIAEKGFRKARAGHTWRERAAELAKEL